MRPYPILAEVLFYPTVPRATYFASLILAVLACFQAVRAHETFFPDGSQWETVGEGYHVVEGIAAKNGTIYYTDVPDEELYRLEPGKPEFLMDQSTAKANGLAFGPDGTLYGVCMAEPRITGWNLDTGARVHIPLPSPANDLVITANGHLYCTWGALSAVYHVNLAKPAPVKVAEMPNPNGITLNRDGTEQWRNFAPWLEPLRSELARRPELPLNA